MNGHGRYSDGIQLTLVASAKGRWQSASNHNLGINTVYDGFIVDTDGVYQIETFGSVGSFRTLTCIAGFLYPIQIVSAGTGSAGGVLALLGGV